ncbi:MAG: phosphocholine cytidylyltransferase family protein [Candidatus Odinarchaeum yellowstonii]|jgi:choline kinase|uniref:Phosphocholine cytidylyltransferase family protein n=1 Tax=Odinarchaeota yellowstonii (strain LCB_4) TaxID=1841599 RepID=A0AAF0D2M8_ODILC|nr:MAG: phosphocholine cytidylyltransferase family protein [Candidatus Odinarchaeum yellowstonii]
MKAVILAAGVNRRLRALAKEIPKCLLKIGNITIIDYQISILSSVGNFKFQDIFIIGGYKIEKLDYLKSFGVNIVYNPKFEVFNNIYSFYLIKNFISEDFILFNGDTVADRRILEFLLMSNNKTIFAVDNVKKLGWEEMKVLVKDNKILKFGKELNPNTAQGEYIGWAKFGWKDATVIFNYIDKLLTEGKTGIWYENAINYVLDEICAFPIYTNGLPWIEIDTPEDYEEAKKLQDKLLYTY